MANALLWIIENTTGAAPQYVQLMSPTNLTYTNNPFAATTFVGHDDAKEIIRDRFLDTKHRIVLLSLQKKEAVHETFNP